MSQLIHSMKSRFEFVLPVLVAVTVILLLAAPPLGAQTPGASDTVAEPTEVEQEALEQSEPTSPPEPTSVPPTEAPVETVAPEPTSAPPTEAPLETVDPEPTAAEPSPTPTGEATTPATPDAEESRTSIQALADLSLTVNGSTAPTVLAGADMTGTVSGITAEATMLHVNVYFNANCSLLPYEVTEVPLTAGHASDATTDLPLPESSEVSYEVSYRALAYNGQWDTLGSSSCVIVRVDAVEQAPLALTVNGSANPTVPEGDSISGTVSGIPAAASSIQVERFGAAGCATSDFLGVTTVSLAEDHTGTTTAELPFPGATSNEDFQVSYRARALTGSSFIARSNCVTVTIDMFEPVPLGLTINGSTSPTMQVGDPVSGTVSGILAEATMLHVNTYLGPNCPGPLPHEFTIVDLAPGHAADVTTDLPLPDDLSDGDEISYRAFAYRQTVEVGFSSCVNVTVEVADPTPTPTPPAPVSLAFTINGSTAPTVPKGAPMTGAVSGIPAETHIVTFPIFTRAGCADIDLYDYAHVTLEPDHDGTTTIDLSLSGTGPLQDYQVSYQARAYNGEIELVGQSACVDVTVDVVEPFVLTINGSTAPTVPDSDTVTGTVTSLPAEATEIYYISYEGARCAESNRFASVKVLLEVGHDGTATAELQLPEAGSSQDHQASYRVQAYNAELDHLGTSNCVTVTVDVEELAVLLLTVNGSTSPTVAPTDAVDGTVIRVPDDATSVVFDVFENAGCADLDWDTTTVLLDSGHTGTATTALPLPAGDSDAGHQVSYRARALSIVQETLGTSNCVTVTVEAGEQFEIVLTVNGSTNPTVQPVEAVDGTVIRVPDDATSVVFDRFGNAGCADTDFIGSTFVTLGSGHTGTATTALPLSAGSGEDFQVSYRARAFNVVQETVGTSNCVDVTVDVDGTTPSPTPTEPVDPTATVTVPPTATATVVASPTPTELVDPTATPSPTSTEPLDPTVVPSPTPTNPVDPTATATVPPNATVTVVPSQTPEPEGEAVITVETSDGGDIPGGSTLCIGDDCLVVGAQVSLAQVRVPSGSTFRFGELPVGTLVVTMTETSPYEPVSTTVVVSAGAPMELTIVLRQVDDPTVVPTSADEPTVVATAADEPTRGAKVAGLPETGAHERGSSTSPVLLLVAALAMVTMAGVIRRSGSRARG